LVAHLEGPQETASDFIELTGREEEGKEREKRRGRDKKGE
jgi:hypothetical protein